MAKADAVSIFVGTWQVISAGGDRRSANPPRGVGNRTGRIERPPPARSKESC